MSVLSRTFSAMLCVCALGASAWAADLSATVPVNVTSDTSADAKNIALAQARRQIVNQVLGRYANPSLVQAAVKNTETSNLMNLVASTSIDGEKVSDTTYSANITMYLDMDASRQWLNSNNIQNWLNASGATGIDDSAVVVVRMSDRLSAWMDLKRVARAEGIDVNTQYIMGNQAVIKIPRANVQSFVNSLRVTGWRAGVNGTDVQIWK